MNSYQTFELLISNDDDNSNLAQIIKRIEQINYVSEVHLLEELDTKNARIEVITPLYETDFDKLITDITDSCEDISIGLVSEVVYEEM